MGPTAHQVPYSRKDFYKITLVSGRSNHLNRALKEVTGKTTTQLVASRLVQEAHALLRHTPWQVAQISYCLGFEEPAHFSNFFRKQTGGAPTAVRAV